MDNKFASYNIHRYALRQLWQADHHLRQLKEQPYLYENPIIQELPRNTPGIYTVEGGRQVGKTTLLKQWIVQLIKEGVDPQSIIFFTGELIDDHHALVNLLQTFIENHAKFHRLFIVIDEVTYIQQWDKAIKFMADAGLFHHCIVILTGSDLTLMQIARMTFPGRRGKADRVDFHVYALSFKETLVLKKSIPQLENYLKKETVPADKIMIKIYEEFNQYLMHGGYLTAINDIARDGKISKSTLRTYSDWIRGDVLKRGKQESYLKEIIAAIITRYNSQVTWHALADVLSIDSHKTVSEYCELLSTMDALFIQSALLLDKLIAAPKKARKLTFTDPFIYHALKTWLNPTDDPFLQIEKDVSDSVISAALVESIVSNHFRRHYPTYYIKADGEIDVVYIKEKKFFPIEVKWRNQLRPEDLKQIKKYPRARVFAKTFVIGIVDGVLIEPLPWALLKSDEEKKSE
ncbi:MAG TPA: ATP-binding protein [Coxiellaceae bacterium]|nr:MAG: ATPase [Gammaproteobacteria bacterium RIFCSPHIGHO2_12_FULL_36_30]HLB57058.1 ATP-binding protein [Coxiellaceae bacterium]